MLPTDKLPQNSRPLYRILTKKSMMGFGKYQDLTLGDVLKIDSEYIVYLYASMDTFSLHRDILSELGLEPIPKPGNDIRVLWRWRDAQREGLTEEQKLHGAFARARGRKKVAVARLIHAKKATSFTKGELQAINHGRGSKKRY